MLPQRPSKGTKAIIRELRYRCVYLGVSARLRLLPEHLHDRLEGEPGGDFIPGAQHLAELGAREVHNVQSLLLGVVGGYVVLLLGVHQVQRGHRGDADLRRVGGGELLGIVCAVEVLAIEAGLAAGHVSADDEVRAAVVLADDHVLHRLAGARHVHRVGQVGPVDAGVLRLLLQHLIGLVPYHAGDVVRLGGAAGGVHQHHGAGAQHGVVQCAREQLVVRAVDGVAALEGHNVHVLGQLGAHLGGGLAGEVAHGHVEAGHLAAAVVLPALHGDHGHGGVLDGGGAVAVLGLQGLVGCVPGGDVQGGDVRALVAEQHLLAHNHARVVGVVDHRQAEDLTAGNLQVVYNGGVVRLLHEAGQGREATLHEQLHIAQLPLVELHLKVARSDRLLLLASIGHHGVNQLATVRGGDHHESIVGGPGGDNLGGSGEHVGAHGERRGRRDHGDRRQDLEKELHGSS
mmetsp:Transcript_19342/g.43698  ORF Transcript_19342/g.43698 Transcript_19342/m.43698 type:complete len:458 (-) Transcript_19342:75-1448(-)